MAFVEPPNPKWTPGTPQKLPFPGTYISLDPAVLGSGATYPLVISAVVPRPIGFLGTVSKEGAVNLAPYSYCGAMSHDPPLVSAFVGSMSSVLCGNAYRRLADIELRGSFFVLAKS
jgi:hypothetical protein